MSVPSVDKNSTGNRDNEKQENGAGSVGENWLGTTVEKNSMTTESQDFKLVDFEELQSTQMSVTENQPSKIDTLSSSSGLNVVNDDKLDEARDSTISKTDQDGGKVMEDEKKVIVEAEKSNDEITTSSSVDKDDEIVHPTPPTQHFSPTSSNVDDDDVVRSTPTDQLFSSTKRQLLGTTGPHKRKASDSDEPTAKIARAEEDVVIPETQESMETDEEEPCTVMVDNEKTQVQSDNPKEIADSNENTVNDTESKQTVNDEMETLQELSQQLEDVLDDKVQIQSDVDPVENIEEPPPGKINSTKVDDVTSAISSGTAKSRMSIEVIYDKSLAPPPKPKELVEIDEDGEKIVLDSSQEDQTLNDLVVNTEKKNVDIQQVSLDSSGTNEKNDNKLTNGNKHEKSKSDTDSTQCPSSELTIDSDRSSDSRTCTLIPNQKLPEILNLISDSEEDSFVSDEKVKIKTIPVEKEFTIVARVKCILHVDEVSKEIASKEVAFASCESSSDLHLSRRRTSSALGLADISGGKDSVSPSSVTSNPRPYALNPRFSIVSTASSSSSSSSGSFKLPKDSVHFSLPRGVPKHAKKAPETSPYEKDWKNVNCLITSLLNVLNSEIMAVDLHNGTVETTNNTSEHFRSSTPELPKENLPTPKTNNKVRSTKRTRSQNIDNRSSNGLSKRLENSPQVVEKIGEVTEDKEQNDSTNESLISAASTPSRQSARSLSILRNQTPVYDPSDALIGKQCFAKWGDNNYYPGIVSSKSKTKFRINFLDGLSKFLMEDFVVLMPEKLPIGLSIYAAVKNDPYGSCGIITNVDTSTNGTFYIVETDEGEKLKVGISEIFLTTDQVAILKESMNEDMKSPPSTPHLGKITLDNIVEGNRRNKSPAISTPKSTRGKSRINTAKNTTDARPSVSGVPSKINFESDSDLKTSDSNASGAEDDGLGAIQIEIIGTSSECTTKGPQHRLKGRARSKKKVEDDETIALLGPIPEGGSTLFKGMNFILTCASLESLDKYKMENKVDSNSESGTDFEQEWNNTPFVRERLTAQITAGGGKVYEKFEDIPESEYKITKLITNVPNITAKSLQCLSVGIPSWNHKWVIRSCLNNKVVNVHHEKLPAGWSLDRKSYVEMSDRPSEKPFNHTIIVVPKIAGVEESTKFWRQIIENAGGTVRLIDDPSDNFVEATAVLTNRQCPIWIEQRAQTENIPLVSTTWIVQCLIAGVIISHESQVAYFHRYLK